MREVTRGGAIERKRGARRALELERFPLSRSARRLGAYRWQPMPRARALKGRDRQISVPDGFSKTSAPALASRERRSDYRVTISSFFFCILVVPLSPRKRGGGPRVLGRAARLIEGPEKPRDAYGSNTLKRSHCERQSKETITLNGGSLGSWVDEERS